MNVVDSESNKETEIDDSEVHFFGKSHTKTYNKNGSFKKFSPYTWVKIDNKIYYTNESISELRNRFQYYDVSRKKLYEDKNGKARTATDWNCEVLEKDVYKIPKDTQELIRSSNEKRRLFTFRNITWFFIMDHVFRNNSTDNYFYYDEEKQKLVDMKLHVLDSNINEETMSEWIDEYRGGSKK